MFSSDALTSICVIESFLEICLILFFTFPTGWQNSSSLQLENKNDLFEYNAITSPIKWTKAKHLSLL